MRYEPLETFNGTLTAEYINTTNGSVMEVTLDGLQEYVEYNITVRAYTTGPGPFNPVPASDRTNEAGKYSDVCLNVCYLYLLTSLTPYFTSSQFLLLHQ